MTIFEIIKTVIPESKYKLQLQRMQKEIERGNLPGSLEMDSTIASFEALYMVSKGYHEKLEKAMPTKVVRSELWTMKDGTTIKVCDMGDTHLLNTINMLKRRSVIESEDLDIPIFPGIFFILEAEAAERFNWEDKDLTNGLVEEDYRRDEAEDFSLGFGCQDFWKD